MIYLDLLLGFLKVGCFSFGGAYAAIPLIRDVVLSYGWIDDEMLSYMIAVSESTPGPIMINLATYVGSVKGGVLGSLLATFAVILPSFIVIILLTALLNKFIENRYVKAVLAGLKPCMIGIILATGVYMILENLFGAHFSAVDFRSLLITAILAGLYYIVRPRLKKGLSPILLIVISAVLGILVYAI